jgi:hypothetical protein
MRIFGLEIGWRKKEEQEATDQVKAPMPKKVKISKIPRIRNPALAFRTRPGTDQFEQPEYNLAEIGRVEDVDSYVRRAFRYKEGLMFKEGWELVGKNPRTIAYVKERLRQMDQATGIPHRILFRDIGKNLIRFSNAYLIKVRKTEASGGKVRSLPGKKTTVQPVAGYFTIPPTTVLIKRDDHGKVKGYKQMMPDGKWKTFPTEKVIHFYFDKKDGFLVGTPTLIPVLDDIRALRRIEENIELLIYQCLFPLFHYKVGTEKAPAREYPDGTREVDIIKAEIEYMPAEGCVVTPERHEIDAIGTEGRALRAEGYVKHFKQRVFAGLGVSAIDFGEGETANRSTAESMSRNMVDDVKAMQRVVEIFINEYIVKELLLESTFASPLDEANLVELKFKEIDLDAQIKVENHAVNAYSGHALTETELRRAFGKEPLTDEEREDTYWKRIQEPELIIQSLDEKYLDEPAARIGATAIEPGDVARGQKERAAERKAKAAKATTAKKPGPKKKKKSSGSRAASSADRPSNQHGRKLSPEKRKSFYLSDAVAPANRLTYMYNDFGEAIIRAMERDMFDRDWLNSTARAIATEMKEKLLRLLRVEFRKGFRSAGARLTYEDERFPFTVLEGRTSRYVDRLMEDLVIKVARISEDIEKFDEKKIKVLNVLDALRYRSRFIYNSEKNKAYNYGRARGMRKLGFKVVEILINPDACEICKARATQMDLENVLIDEVPGFHSNCRCAVGQPILEE